MKLAVCILSEESLSRDREELNRQISALPFGKEEAERLMGRGHLPTLARSILARRALTSLLEKHRSPPRPIRYSPDGKPYFEGESAPSFSLSHSENWAVAVLCEAGSAIGADIEQTTPHRRTEALAHRFLTPDEQIQWESSPCPDLAFLRIWTEKEAAAKWDG